MTSRMTASVIAMSMVMAILPSGVFAEDIKGRVTDKATNEPLIGATVVVGEKGAATNIDGEFVITGLEKREYELTATYVGYKTKKQKAAAGDGTYVNVEMESDETQLGEVRVTGMARKDSERAMIEAARISDNVINNISAQEIRRNQDSNAGEVIRRIPGVSLIDDKFVMVRGLSQRYNNVWINGGGVPSSEADSRAFSFDIIPSSQIDNLIIVKSPSAEFPADFTGGFIQINTKDIPATSNLSVSAGMNWNDATCFNDFSHAKLSGVYVPDGHASLTDNSLNNDWRVKTRKPYGDIRAGSDWSLRWNMGRWKAGMVGALNYTKEARTYENMTNNLFGVYDAANDRSNYLRQSTDNQYNDNERLGGMMNLTMLSPDGNSRYELKNIVNRIINRRYTDRGGINAQSDNEIGAEYYYRSRMTYNAQLTGKHTMRHDEAEWSVSYSYANRRMPDRHRYTIDDALERGQMMLTAGNEINREFTRLDEHIVSANINDKHHFNIASISPTLKTGAYGEYRTRDYKTRQFIYTWDMDNNTLPDGFRKMDMTELLSNPEYFGDKKLGLLEEQCMRNNYGGNNILGAGYVSAVLPVSSFNISAGVRYEYNRMELITNSRDDKESPQSRYYSSHDIFPSAATTYHIGKKSQLRLSYGKSVNRAEFREVSPSVYYDFDLASHVQGNVSLRPCYIHNLDLRYELYPSLGEQITVAAFYKRFNNPIEWTYTVAGGTNLIYSYENAQSADNYGIELDIRKDLSFIGLRNFSLSFNGALIHSRVNFPDGSRNENRPMQGQSPYLVNTGLFYKNERMGLNVSLLYNRIGRRIIGVGRSEGSTGSEDNARVPDSYEMPRDMFDIAVTKKWGSHFELKAGVRDILAQSVCYKQFAEVKTRDGQTKEVEQITRRYTPGRNINLTAVVTF